MDKGLIKKLVSSITDDIDSFRKNLFLESANTIIVDKKYNQEIYIFIYFLTLLFLSINNKIEERSYFMKKVLIPEIEPYYGKRVKEYTNAISNGVSTEDRYLNLVFLFSHFLNNEKNKFIISSALFLIRMVDLKIRSFFYIG